MPLSNYSMTRLFQDKLYIIYLKIGKIWLVILCLFHLKIYFSLDLPQIATVLVSKSKSVHVLLKIKQF